MTYTSPSIPASTTPVTPTRLFGEPKEYVIPRKGDRNLAFKGWRIGTDFSSTDDSGVEVCIYLTEGENLITDVRRWSENLTARAESCRLSADGEQSLVFLAIHDDGECAGLDPSASDLAARSVLHWLPAKTLIGLRTSGSVPRTRATCGS